MVDASGTDSVGSSQGANRSKSITDATGFDPTKSQAGDATKVASSELGGNRSPNETGGVGSKSINTGNSTDIRVPPEVGKGSITDSVT
tara:strand:- start:121 stop:384 length:264 start_codon:yes stop_codon:yes gene_type:complete